MAENKISIYDVLFSITYFALYILQMLPHFAIMFMPTASVWFWISIAIGVGALVAQQIKFPCFTSRIWSSAMIWFTIAAFIWR